MSEIDLDEWSTVNDVPARTNGIVTYWNAKQLFAEREANGLAAAGAAVKVGRHGYLHVPKLLDHLFNQQAA